MPASRAPRPACDYERAYRELVGGSPVPPARPCSPEVPEPRAYPAPPAGSTGYALCNGHLSDLFDARERAARPVPLSGAQ